MQYENIHRAVFLARPNRFIAEVELSGAAAVCHVKNTGRCRELLIPGATVYLEESANPARKTKYDLIAVEKERPGLPPLLINMDAQAPNQVFGAWMAAGEGVQAGLPCPTLLRPETKWGNSRFDFYWEAGERRGFVEVKGVTLEEHGAVRFPDAPTERGVKHLHELAAVREAGYEACVFFVVQMEGAALFSPNDMTHPAFGHALRAASESGVLVLAYGCAVTPDSLKIRYPVEVRLQHSL